MLLQCLASKFDTLTIDGLFLHAHILDHDIQSLSGSFAAINLLGFLAAALALHASRYMFFVWKNSTPHNFL